MKKVQKFKLTRGHPPWCPVSKKYLKTPQKTKKTGQKYKNDPKRAKNRKIGHFSSGPQSIILKIAWNDLSICILTGLGSTFWVTEKSGQKWFHGSVQASAHFRLIHRIMCSMQHRIIIPLLQDLVWHWSRRWGHGVTANSPPRLVNILFALS